MKKIITLFMVVMPFFAKAQNVGIGTNSPNSSALLEISSTNKGMLVPRLTTLQRKYYKPCQWVTGI
ncbi:MAG: hypothetical protein IPP72_15225 [Chitinophagaceae bacterium]|nr:hypothetical protein [Chitinophagaceae bacterium]